MRNYAEGKTYMVPVAEKLPVGVNSKVVYRTDRSDYPARNYNREQGTIVHIVDEGFGPIFYLRMDGHAKPKKGWHVSANRHEIQAVREAKP